MFMNRTQRVIHKTSDCNLSDDGMAGEWKEHKKTDAKPFLRLLLNHFDDITLPFRLLVVFYSRWQSSRDNQLHGNNSITTSRHGMRICYECHVWACSRTLVSEKREKRFFMWHSHSLLCSSLPLSLPQATLQPLAIDDRRRFISFRYFQRSFLLLVITVAGMRHKRVHSRWFTLPHKTESRLNIECLVNVRGHEYFLENVKKATTYEWNILSSNKKKNENWYEHNKTKPFQSEKQNKKRMWMWIGLG